MVLAPAFAAVLVEAPPGKAAAAAEDLRDENYQLWEVLSISLLFLLEEFPLDRVSFLPV